jgi:hypothetical protein
MFIEEKILEGLGTELALFILPSTKTSVTVFYYAEIRKITQTSETMSRIEFRRCRQNSMDYWDIKGTQLYAKIGVKTLEMQF